MGKLQTAPALPRVLSGPSIPCDGRQVMATLQHGLETPEHAAFVQQFQARRSAS